MAQINDPINILSKIQASKAFIFDMDGTLVDLEKLNFDSFNKAIQTHLGKDLTPEEYQLYFSGVGSEAGFRNYLISIQEDPEQTITLLNTYRIEKGKSLHTRLNDVVTIKPGAKEFLKTLKSLNRPTALATSTIREFTMLTLKAFNIEDLFDVILTIEDIPQGKGKPNPDIYNKALQLLGADKSTSICFEDSIGGLKAAKNAGLFTIGIHTPGLNDKYINQADYIVEDYVILQKYLLNVV